MIKSRSILWTLGVSLMVVGVGVMTSIPFFYYRSYSVGHQLLKQSNQLVSPSVQPIKNTGAVVSPSYHTGQLMGKVVIPALSVQAPLIEGTNSQQLDVAAGHLSTSVLPGKVGTSVIAAHNATWFRHVNQLKSGDLIQVDTVYGKMTFRITKSKIVHEGDSILNTSTPSLVLESCYPLDALYLTPYRYLVYANLVQSGQADANWQQGLAQKSSFFAQIPQNIRNEGLTLQTNSLPMGTLKYAGHPANSFEQSDLPLSASSTMVQLYLAWVHASSNRDAAALRQLHATVSNNPFLGVPIADIRYDSLFDIQLTVSGTNLQAALASTVANVNGHRYQITLTYTVSHLQIGLGQIRVVQQS